MNLLYANDLKQQSDVEDFILEGYGEIWFEDRCMHMKNGISGEMGQKANYVLWCPEIFPKNIRIEWEFKPLSDRGLCILFFAAKGRNGKDLFDESLPKRTGEYVQYHSGEMDAFHVSYFRRKEADERAFHTCNLRKSKGFYLVAQGADPIPEFAEAKDFYHMAVEKSENQVSFSVNGLEVFRFLDDGEAYGPLLLEGRIGFRQLAPLEACYRNLRVYEIGVKNG